ncbi:MAG: NAD(P)-dependent oxidoreductase [Candidatus Omnitrophica bacterium]|nr:NAD(P)-dependent oxidoreductase [Candidatus Omnitrophota bacterium]
MPGGKHQSGINRVLILGHSGFIGRHLRIALEESGSGLSITGRSMSDLDLTKADDVATLADVVNPETAVVVCAAIKKQFGDNLGVFEHNIEIIANLCRFFQAHPVGRVVYFSSAAVYGEDVHNLAITEGTPVCPRSYYGLAKYVSECLLEKAVEHRNIRSLLVLRPPLIFGPGDTSESYGPVGFILKAMRGEPIILWGDGGEKRCFVYVEDVAQVVSRLTLSSYEGKVNIASIESHSFREVLDLVAQAFPSSFEVSEKKRTKVKVDNVFDNTRLMSMVEPFSFTSLSTGVQKTTDFLKNNSR